MMDRRARRINWSAISVILALAVFTLAGERRITANEAVTASNTACITELKEINKNIEKRLDAQAEMLVKTTAILNLMIEDAKAHGKK